jgi:hypothetical protein
LGELHTGSLLLLELNIIWANDDLHVESGVVHGIGHEGWDNMDWGSLSLGKGNSDWCWLVGNEVLEVSSGDVGVHKLEETVGIGLLGVELNESLGNWSVGVLDKVNEGRLGNILTVKLSNLD